MYDTTIYTTPLLIIIWYNRLDHFIFLAQNNFSTNNAICNVLNVSGCFLMRLLTLNILCFNGIYNSINNNNIIQPITNWISVFFCFSTRRRTNQNKFITNTARSTVLNVTCCFLIMIKTLNIVWYNTNTARCTVLNVTGCFLMMIKTLNIVWYNDMYN